MNINIHTWIFCKDYCKHILFHVWDYVITLIILKVSSKHAENQLRTRRKHLIFLSNTYERSTTSIFPSLFPVQRESSHEKNRFSELITFLPMHLFISATTKGDFAFFLCTQHFFILVDLDITPEGLREITTH